MNPEQLLAHLLTGPENVTESDGLKFLALDAYGRIVEVPGAFMASEPLFDQFDQYLYDTDV